MFGPGTTDTKKYISLQEAAEYSGIYSQEYLSLRARHGKLKAVKLGRNWVTTKEWVSEYIHSEHNLKANGIGLVSVQGTEFLESSRNSVPSVFDKFAKGLVYSLSGCLIIASFVLGFSNYKIGVSKIIAQISNFEILEVEQVADYFKGEKEILVFFASQFEFSNKIENATNKVGDVGNDFKNFTFEKSLWFLNRAKSISWQLSWEYKNTLENIFGDLLQILTDKTNKILKFSKNGTESLLSHSEKLKNIDSKEIWRALLTAKNNTSDYIAGFPLFVKDEFIENFKEKFQSANVSFKSSKNLLANVATELKVQGVQGTEFLYSEGTRFLRACIFDAISQSKQNISSAKNNFIENLKGLKSFIVSSVQKGAKFVASPWLEKDQQFLVEAPEGQTSSKLKEVRPPTTQTITQVEKNVQPVKEITREVIKETITNKVDSQELAELKANIANLQLQAGRIQYYSPSNSAPTSPVYIGSSGLEISGNASLASLGVSGFAGIRDLGVGNSFSVGGSGGSNLTVDKDGNLKANAITSGSLTTASVNSTGDITATGDLSVGGSTTISGNLNVGGIATFSTSTISMSTTTASIFSIGTSTTANLFTVGGSGNIVFQNAGQVYILPSGTTTIGASTSTPTILTGYIASDILPRYDNTYSIGSSVYRWKQGYFGDTLSVNGTSTQATTSITQLLVSGNGFVAGGFGIGTTTAPFSLTVSGQCVTGDTKLRRRRRKLKTKNEKLKNDDYIYDEVAIKDIQIGDEISTLDESTGKLVWRKVEALWDMGKKQIYKLTTESGKTIRTTENHPYLALSKTEGLAKKTPQKLFRFEVDQSIRIEELNKDTIIGLANKENSFTSVLHRKVKRHLYEVCRKQGLKKQFGPLVFAAGIIAALQKSTFIFREITIDFEYPGYELFIERIIKKFFPDLFVSFSSIGKKSFAHYAAYGVCINKKTADAKISIAEFLEVIQKLKDRPTVTPLDKSQTIRSRKRSVDSSITNENSLSSAPTRWTKVVNLQVGDRIAVAGSCSATSSFERIASIELLPAEQVYDITVKGTHNFVANGIIAHNTYITSTTTLASDLNVANNTLFVDALDGRVGIGTSTPGFNLTTEGTQYTTGATYFGSTLNIAATSTQATTSITQLLVSGNSILSGGLWVSGTSTLSGDVTVSRNLLASDDLTVTATTTLNGDVVLGDTSSDNITIIGRLATTTLASGVVLGGDISGVLDLTVNGTSTLATTSITNLGITGNGSVLGSWAVGSTLNIAATSTQATTSITQLLVSGNSILSGGLSIGGNATTSGYHYIGSGLQVNGNIYGVNYYGSANNLTNIPATTTFNSATVSGTLEVTATSTLATTTVTFLSISGNGTVAGSLGVGTNSPIAMMDVRGTIENGLVGWWPMDEGTGGTVVDKSIGGHNGTIVDASCPAGYISVPGSSTFGTSDFCVMQYEAKNVGGVATSQASGNPWVSITQTTAITTCAAAGGHLITNNEWMTIARNAEQVTGNWSGGSVGSGALATGWVNTSNTAVAPTTDASCLYNTGANTCNSAGTVQQRRTLSLSNGLTLWDISGNVWEWTNDTCSQTNWHSHAAWHEWSDADLADYEKPNGGPLGAYTSTNGAGQYYGCTANGNAFIRGGAWGSGAYAGAFALILYSAPGGSGAGIGFRCVR